MRSLTCNGRQSAMRRQKINGRRRAALVRCEPAAARPLPPYQPAARRIWSRPTSRANQALAFRRSTEQPSRRDWARPDGGVRRTTRSERQQRQRQQSNHKSSPDSHRLCWRSFQHRLPDPPGWQICYCATLSAGSVSRSKSRAKSCSCSLTQASPAVGGEGPTQRPTLCFAGFSPARADGP